MKTKLLIAVSICALLLIAGCTQNQKKDNNNNDKNDKVPPTNLTISINNYKNYTTSSAVQLTVSAQDDIGVTEMAFSNDNVTWSPWENYTTSKSWNLTTGDGEKTVYFNARDKAGNKAEPAMDRIILDTALPVVTGANPGIGMKDIPFDGHTVTVTFSEELDPGLNTCPFSLGYAANLGDLVSTDFRYVDKNKIECKYTEDLLPDTAYRVDLNGNPSGSAKDLAGNPAKMRNWTFTTRAAKFETVSKVVYTPPGSGSTYVYGEVKNTDTFSFSFVNLDLEFFDASHESLFTMNTTIEHNTTFPIIPPGQVVPFVVVVPDANARIKDASVVAGKNLEQRMKMTNKTLYTQVITQNVVSSLDTNSGYKVNGQLKNNGDKMAEYFVVIATFYDLNHAIVGVQSFERSDLGPGMTGSFGILLSNSQADVNRVTQYSLMVYVSP